MGRGSLQHHLLVWPQHTVEHFGDLLSDERDGPAEHVHKVREEVGMGCIVVLLDVQCVVLRIPDEGTTNLMTAPLLR